MNDLQIKYFLKAAQRLNFSEAAKELFISQSALSQQIAAIEKELNMQLFIRDRNKLRLTPAATVLLQELPDCSRRLQEAIAKARVVNEGYSGFLQIGILEGQILPANFSAAYHAFRKAYPGIHMEFSMASFGQLRQQMDEGKVDVALTINFDVTDSSSYLWVKTDPDVCAIFASKSHPIVNRPFHGWKDLKNETVILVGTEDSEKVKELVMEDCRKAEISPQFLLAPSLNDQMLWIDAGLGIGISNTDAYISVNPNVQCLKKVPIPDNYFVVAWHRENLNSAVALFTNFVAEYVQKNELL